jgi:hypothetical protein
MYYDIVEKFGLPREYCTCPGCGQLYGHHRTKVCENCAECSSCCKEQDPMTNLCADEHKWVLDIVKFVNDQS